MTEIAALRCLTKLRFPWTPQEDPSEGITHIDLRNFYVRCECFPNPTLRCRPVMIRSSNKVCAAATVIPLAKNAQPRKTLRVFAQ